MELPIFVDHSAWKIVFSSSESQGEEAQNAIDGDPSTVVTRLLPNFSETAYVCTFPPSMNSNGAVYAQMCIRDRLKICQSIRDRIDREIDNDPPLLINKGGVIKSGVSAELDELRRIAYSGKDYLLQIQQRLSLIHIWWKQDMPRQNIRIFLPGLYR